VDTRTKIVPSDEAVKLAVAGAVVVSGHFDPMLASHARSLAAVKRNGQPLLVLITTPENPILPARARAELVASLGAVDHVAEFAPGIPVYLNLESEDEMRMEKLIEHVHARQSATS
jgi:bifunctional ADP-heptose synthase (sugar kinase/adenylyltransferase)